MTDRQVVVTIGILHRGRGAAGQRLDFFISCRRAQGLGVGVRRIKVVIGRGRRCGRAGGCWRRGRYRRCIGCCSRGDRCLTTTADGMIGRRHGCGVGGHTGG